MAEIRLVFDAKTESEDESATCNVRVDYITPGASLVGVKPQPFEFELDGDDYAELRWYLEEFMDCPDVGSRVRAARIEKSVDDWGRGLYKAVFDHGDHRDRIRDLLAVKSPEPRLLTIATNDSDILRLPWELIADKRGPLSRRGVTVRRQLETAKEDLRYQVGVPLRVLVIVSRPDDTGFIDPRHSTRAMLESLEPLAADVVVDFCRPPTLARLEEVLSEAAEAGEPYTIIHFNGHGDYDPLLGLGVLCFEKPQQAGAANVTKDTVRADILGNLLAKYEIPLVVLEACRTSQVEAVAFRSVAPRLIEAGVGGVVAMSYAVHVEAAKILTQRFYRELVKGCAIGQAMEEGRAALLVSRDRWLKRGPNERAVQLTDWFLPQLYQRGNDLKLVTSGKKKRRPAGAEERKRVLVPTGEDVGAFPRPPMHGFHGRARELYKLERAFRLDRAVLLHAMGGMGKTALATEAAAWLTKTGLFTDGACFVSFEHPTTAERVAQVLGTYLDGPEFAQLSEDEQRKRACKLFESKRVLLVWDNYESVLPTFAKEAGREDDGYSDEERTRLVSLFRDLTASSTGHGRLLVTCRPEESQLPGIRRMELGGLERPDSLYLLAEVMRKHDLSLDDERFTREDLDRLLDTLADHPLSIELVGPHLKNVAVDKIVADFDELLTQFTGDAEVERNKSLLASLRFSSDRLSPAARAALTWLGLFRRGVFEDVLLKVSQIDPDAWGAVRAELEATALVRVEHDIQVNKRPYLRFHPTLAYATEHVAEAASSAAEESPTGEQPINALRDADEARQRFIAVYDALDTMLRKALRGSEARGGMEVLAREEANFRAAVRWAVEAGSYDVAGPMADTFRGYLERSARLRERDRWVQWLADEAKKADKFSAAAAAAEKNAAWSLFTQGRAGDAVAKLEALIDRLRQTTQFDPAFQLALTQQVLGRVYYAAGAAEQAIPILEKAVKDWEKLAQRAKTRGGSTEAERGNLAVALSDLANAFRRAGRLDEALETSERSNEIDAEAGRDPAVAAGLGQMAAILAEQGRYGEADARYDEALSAARRVNDEELEASLLQHQGGLACDTRQYDRAAKLYQRALKLFQDAHNDGAVMRTCNLLGVVEQEAGRLAEARAWYERSREIAQRREDRESGGIAAQNIGIVCQQEAEAARQRGDEAAARQHFQQAERFLRESLDVWRETANRPFEASSFGQLARLYLLTGELDKAEEHTRRGLEIRERLGLKEVYRDYNNLAEIARARGDAAQAAEWEAKRDRKLKELDDLAAGGAEGGPTLPEEFVKAVASLAVACVQAGVNRSPLSKDVEAAVNALDQTGHPLQPIVPLLRGFVAGDIPATPDAVPGDLPPALRGVLGQLIEAVNEAQAGQ